MAVVGLTLPIIHNNRAAVVENEILFNYISIINLINNIEIYINIIYKNETNVYFNSILNSVSLFPKKTIFEFHLKVDTNSE